MVDKKQASELKFKILRQQAEDLISHQAHPAEERPEGRQAAPVDIRGLVHELEVHQIELEMQNEELVQAQVELEKARDRYIDLYDFAPVGYLTLNEKGMILEANLTAAGLLGVERKKLIRQRLTHFILREDQDAFYLFSKKLFETQTHQDGEVRLVPGGQGSEPLSILLQGIFSLGEGGEPVCHLSISDISKQKAAEKALAESELRFRTMSDFTQDWEYWLDPAGNFVYISPSSEAISGYRPEEFRKDPGLLPKILYVEDRQVWQKHEGLVAQSNQADSIDLRIVTRAGEVRWINHVCRPVYGAGGQWLGRRISNRDITRRKQAEEALRENQANLQGLLEFTTGIVWSVDRQYRMIAGNDRFRKNYISVLGREIRPGESTLVEGLPDVYQEWRGYYERALAGETFKIESPTRAQPELSYLEFTFRPVYTAAGSVSGVIVAGRDVTERVQTQEALEQSEDRFARAFFDAPVALSITRAKDGTFIEVNERFVQLFGYSRNELIGRTSVEIGFYADDRQRANVNNEFAADNYLSNLEITTPTKSGTQLNVLISAVPIVVNGEKCNLGTVIDITERKKAEEERENLIGQLNAAQEQQQLLAGRLMAAQENERRVIARELHDEVGQALTALKINLQTVQRKQKNALDLSESIGMVEQTLQQVRAISLNLPPTVLEDLGLAAALRWLLDRQGREAGFSTSFSTSLEDMRLPPQVEIACFRVAQEALTNVMRHAQAQHVNVKLEKINQDLHLTLRDDGRGYDVEAAYKRAWDGNSLGLVSMQERVVLAGGRMEIESMQDQGTTIHAIFPLARPNPDDGEREKLP
jgi:PAS domain S-box-containing protein